MCYSLVGLPARSTGPHFSHHPYQRPPRCTPLRGSDRFALPGGRQLREGPAGAGTAGRQSPCQPGSLGTGRAHLQALLHGQPSDCLSIAAARAGRSRRGSAPGPGRCHARKPLAVLQSLNPREAEGSVILVTLIASCASREASRHSAPGPVLPHTLTLTLLLGT
ncbi:Dihydrolipoamide acyltransferase [Giardia duodenalis]|uniref:Dihydrolipoamide acyltransferase n=1 Tax=Giardia intestinalis TaxID=5741 RepID=V6TSH5_GIAIN|nr:Dihydrolipoamide acyltransferase [Giardia intestinalis]